MNDVLILADTKGLENDARVATAAKAVSEEQVSELLGGFAADMQTYDRDRLAFDRQAAQQHHDRSRQAHRAA